MGTGVSVGVGVVLGVGDGVRVGVCVGVRVGVGDAVGVREGVGVIVGVLLGGRSSVGGGVGVGEVHSPGNRVLVAGACEPESPAGFCSSRVGWDVGVFSGVAGGRAVGDATSASACVGD